ncbi:hypothetical protein D3C73_1431710 [compost metagenome]
MHRDDAVVDLQMDVDRRLAFRHALVHLRVRRDLLGDGRQLVGELQQEQQAIGLRGLQESVADLGEGVRNVRRAHPCHCHTIRASRALHP